MSKPVRKRRTRASYAEQQIQTAIVDFLRRALPRRAVVFSVPNETTYSPAARAALIAAGMVPKFPDLCISLDGLYVLEVKRPETRGKTGMHEIAQGVVQQHLRESGAKVAVVWSIETAEAALLEWGFNLRARTGANFMMETGR